LGEVEKSKQKSEKDKPDLRQWQTFILAVIIISAYVVFFAWIMSTSPVTTDKLGKNVIDYTGMTTLTGTFGIIAAAVVGYYFGTRNLEQATNMAVESKVNEKEAKKEADESKVYEKEAKKEAVENKIELKNELDDRVPSLEKGKEIYDQANKFVDSTLDSLGKIDPANKKLILDSISEKMDVKDFKSKLENRIKEVDHKLATKKQKREEIKNSIPNI
jgi:hypothetical protein